MTNFVKMSNYLEFLVFALVKSTYEWKIEAKLSV